MKDKRQGKSLYAKHWHDGSKDFPRRRRRFKGFPENGNDVIQATHSSQYV